MKTHCTQVARIVLAAALLACLPAGRTSAAQNIDWQTGPALRKKLQQRESVAWSGQGLRDALRAFSSTHGVAILLDRRVDPGQPLEAALQDTALLDVLTTVAEKHDLGLSVFDSLVYLGPPQTAARLRTIAALRKEDLGQLATTRRLVWAQARPWQWEDFSTPRQLLEQLAKDGRFEIRNLDVVPHDLWAAADLPPMGLADRLTLVLAQFDWTFRLQDQGAAIEIEPLPADVWIERTYPGGRDLEAAAQKFAAAAPKATVSVRGGKIVVRGRVEDHELLAGGSARPSGSASRTPAAGGKDPLDLKKFTLTAMNQPVQAILGSLQKQLGLEIRTDPMKLRQSGKSLEQLIDVKVENASLDETLKAVLKPAGLTFRRTGTTVEVFPAEP